MIIDTVRRHCLSMNHVSESVLWGNNLVFKVGGKMFAIAMLEPAKVCLAFQCSADEFAELTERPGIIPAPYLARYRWVGLEHADALSRSELQRLLSESYTLVFGRLPKKTLAALGSINAGKDGKD